MVGVDAVNVLEMQGDAGVHGEGLEPFAHKFGIEVPDLGARKVATENEEGAAGHIDSAARQGFIHGQVTRAIAADSLAVAQGLGDRLTQGNAGIFHGVMIVNVQVAFGFQCHVDQRMAGQLLQHMVEETYSRSDFICAFAVEVDFACDFSFCGFAADFGGSHEG